MNKKTTGAFTIAAMMLTLGIMTPTAQAAEPYRIGAAFALTGPAAMIGEPSMKMAQMLLEEINAAGGVNGHPIEDRKSVV